MSIRPVPFAPPLALVLSTAPAGSVPTSASVPGTNFAGSLSASSSSTSEMPAALTSLRLVSCRRYCTTSPGCAGFWLTTVLVKLSLGGSVSTE